jgi:hypothetical protein
MLLRAILASSVAIASVACSSKAPDTATPDAAKSAPVDAAKPPMDAGAPDKPQDAATSVDAGAGDAGPDLFMEAGDFTCILDWKKVGDFRITNKLTDASSSIAVAEDPDGGIYPVGTVIQLIPNEAMAKHRVGWNPATRDWEFFNLTASAAGTVINQRGGVNVTNAIGSCYGCHSAAEPQFDLICGTTHGCAPLPFTEAQIQTIQNGDPRCGD